jgi:hypothetical protein
LGRDAALAEKELKVAIEHAEEAVMKMEQVAGILPAVESPEADSREPDVPPAPPAKKAKKEKPAAKTSAKKKSDKRQLALL